MHATSRFRKAIDNALSIDHRSPARATDARGWFALDCWLSATALDWLLARGLGDQQLVRVRDRLRAWAALAFAEGCCRG